MSTMPFVKSDKPTKSKIVKLRVNRHEEAALMIAAAEAGMTKTDWVIRQATADDFTYSIGGRDDAEGLVRDLGEAYFQLARVSNNLLQLRATRSDFALFSSETDAIFAVVDDARAAVADAARIVSDAVDRCKGELDEVFACGQRQVVMRAYPEDYGLISRRAEENGVSVNMLLRSIIHRSPWFVGAELRPESKSVAEELTGETGMLRQDGIALNDFVHQVHADLVNADFDSLAFVASELNRSARIIRKIEADAGCIKMLVNALSSHREEDEGE